MTDLSDARLLLDVSRLVWRAWEGRLPTGIDRTCLAYVAHYQYRARAVIQRGSFTRVLSLSASRQLFDLLLHGVNVRSRLLVSLAVAVMGSTRFGDLSDCYYLNVGHTGLDKAGHREWIARTGVQPIYFVHDLIPLTHPEYCRPGEPQKHLQRMTALLAHGTGIIANSHDTLNELEVFARSQGRMEIPPALAAPLGVTLDQGIPDSSQSLPSRAYFVMLGTIEGRKNHLLILNVWVELVRRLGAACPLLVIIGQRGWECEQAVDMLERCTSIRDHVVELSNCSDSELAAYIRDARALLFPSFVEGFGLPLVEALACKTPVIASNLPVFRELAGDVADYLSPIDGLGWVSLIDDYAKPDSLYRSRQINRIANWSPPSWEAHFAAMDGWLRRLPLIQKSAKASND